MQISLRKANALQLAINEALKGLNFKTEVSINEFQKPEATIDAAHDTFFENLNRRNALLRAFYEIRKSVSAVNAAQGIDVLLADLAFLEKEVIFFTTHSKTQERLAEEIIKGKLEKISQRTEDSYYSKAEVETSVFVQTELRSFAQLASTTKKQKQKLQDELLELNVRTTIDLSEQAVATLTAEDIL